MLKIELTDRTEQLKKTVDKQRNIIQEYDKTIEEQTNKQSEYNKLKQKLDLINSIKSHAWGIIYYVRKGMLLCLLKQYNRYYRSFMRYSDNSESIRCDTGIIFHDSIKCCDNMVYCDQLYEKFGFFCDNNFDDKTDEEWVKNTANDQIMKLYKNCLRDYNDVAILDRQVKKLEQTVREIQIKLRNDAILENKILKNIYIPLLSHEYTNETIEEILPKIKKLKQSLDKAYLNAFGFEQMLFKVFNEKIKTLTKQINDLRFIGNQKLIKTIALKKKAEEKLKLCEKLLEKKV